ncbi:MAG: hypothetical protein GY847_17050 [Proteobacteria bacterium]|nr:hypothetical protein [Pseudomonadota bacterium]
MKKILIYDDDEQIANDLKRGLSKLSILENSFDIKTLAKQDFDESMTVLQKRQIAFREDGGWRDEQASIDEASILIIDYDLVKSGAFWTGEIVAYLARCFSRCGLIVGVNQYLGTDFDLTLKGHPESFADLNVTESQLSNPNLWGGTRAGFRPWYWPILPNYLSDFEKKVEDVKKSLDEDTSICRVLGFDPELFDILPRSISQFVGLEPVKTTFRQFVMESGNGLRPKDAVHDNDDVLARVGAARISKWLERLVLPEQDILVDAPHLVSRYPSLMAGEIKDIKTWNKTAQLTSYQKLGLSTELIEPFRLKKEYWLSRSVWFWDELRGCEKIIEVREPWKIKRPNWVFCEDASRFYKGQDHREFVADTESPFARRFVKRFKGVNYRPIVRFSL